MKARRHWESVYGRKQPQQVSWYQGEPSVSLELIQRTGVRRDASIIDVGGGASVLVDCLIERGFEDLTVLDVSGTALACARKRLGRRAEAVSWIETDVTEYDPPRTFMLWHDRAVFHFLTEPEDRRRYVSALKRGLAPNGHLIMATFAIGGPERCSGLEIVQYDSKKLLDELGTGFRLVEERMEDHVTPAGAHQKFAWFCLTRASG